MPRSMRRQIKSKFGLRDLTAGFALSVSDDGVVSPPTLRKIGRSGADQYARARAPAERDV